MISIKFWQKGKSGTFKVKYLYKLRKYFGKFAKECFVV